MTFLKDKLKGKKADFIFAAALVLMTMAGSSMLTGCAAVKEALQGGNAAAESTESASTEDAAAAETAADLPPITVHVPEKEKEFTEAAVEEFLKEEPDAAAYEITVSSAENSETPDSILAKPSSEADLFTFTQEKLGLLAAAGALEPLTEEEAEDVRSRIDEMAVQAASAKGKADVSDSQTGTAQADTLYAFPLTLEGGYFLYYDKNVITDPSSLQQILDDCAAAERDFCMDITSGWYQAAFFLGTGCSLSYGVDGEGNFISAGMDYASENGAAALKAMLTVKGSKAFNNSFSVGSDEKAAAVISGMWDRDSAGAFFGTGYACAPLPSFTAGDTECRMSGLCSFELLGVRPQEDEDKLNVCRKLAEFLSSDMIQAERYEAVALVPADLSVQQEEEVRADAAAAAMIDQVHRSQTRALYPNEFWTLSSSLGDAILAGDYDKASDDALLDVLQTMQDSCAAYVQTETDADKQLEAEQ